MSTRPREDIIRTLQVLKADNRDAELWDLLPSGFVFLRDQKGEIMRYPSGENIPENFRDKPIAFIRDLNAISTEFIADRNNSISRICKGLGITSEDYEKILPASQACVDACKQQYALTKKLADNLRRHGIEPNVEIPNQEFSSRIEKTDIYRSGRII